MSSIFLKILITSFIINTLNVSKNHAIQNNAYTKYPYDLSVSSYADYDLSDKNIDSKRKLAFTPINLIKSYVTNKVYNH